VNSLIALKCTNLVTVKYGLCVYDRTAQVAGTCAVGNYRNGPIICTVMERIYVTKYLGSNSVNVRNMGKLYHLKESVTIRPIQLHSRMSKWSVLRLMQATSAQGLGCFTSVPKRLS
jgi:hypothetical protein